MVSIVEWTKPIYAFLFKRKALPWSVSMQRLRRFPAKSLGRELANFLDNEGLTLLPKMEEHDVMHVLMHYKTTVVDEARMQFFLLGNRKRSLYALACAMASLVLIPEKIPAFWEEFKKGRKYNTVWTWDFRHLLNEPIDLLRKMLSKEYRGEEVPFIV